MINFKNPLVIGACVGLGFLLLKDNGNSRSPKRNDGTFKPPSPKPQPPRDFKIAKGVRFPLRHGSGMGGRYVERDYVKIIQRWANKKNKGIPTINVDGMWGPKTQAALAKNGITEISKANFLNLLSK